MQMTGSLALRRGLHSCSAVRLDPRNSVARTQTQTRILSVALLVSALVSSASALVSTHRIVHSNRRWISLGQFEFQSGGGVEVNASDVILYSPERASPVDTNSIGFLLAEPSDAAAIEAQDPESGETGRECPLGGTNVTVLFRIHDMPEPGTGGKRPEKVETITVASGGKHTLYLINCVASRLVSARVQVGMWNTGPASTRLYLPPGEFYLALVLLVTAGLTVLLLAWWLFQVLKVWCQAVNPPAYQVLLTLALPLLAATAVSMGMSLLIRQAYGASPAWDWLTDGLIAASAGTLTLAFVCGIERVDAYLNDVERLGVYVAVPVWMVCQSALLMTRNDGMLAQAVPHDSVFFTPLVDQLEGGVLFALGVLSVLVSLEVLGFCCSLALRKRSGRGPAKDDRMEDGPVSKLYVRMSMCMIGTTGIALLLRVYLPLYLQWLADALCYMSLFVFMVHVMSKVRPRMEKSVYQLFDESDDMDEELAEL